MSDFFSISHLFLSLFLSSKVLDLKVLLELSICSLKQSYISKQRGNVSAK